MNPFSKYLRQWSNDGEFETFVEHWDRLERIVIGVYRGKLAVEAAAEEFERVWPWLRERYPDWAEILRPHWQATRAAGEPTRDDPFLLLLTFPELAAIRGDWRAMQHLPAAREAINRYLVAQNLEEGP
jgi:hypothetical protein